jgi:hypothetical protein
VRGSLFNFFFCFLACKKKKINFMFDFVHIQSLVLLLLPLPRLKEAIGTLPPQPHNLWTGLNNPAMDGEHLPRLAGVERLRVSVCVCVLWCICMTCMNHRW